MKTFRYFRRLPIRIRQIPGRLAQNVQVLAVSLWVFVAPWVAALTARA